MDNKNLKNIFDTFKDDNDTISFLNMKRILNILRLDIEKVTKKDKYSFDEFYHQVLKLLDSLDDSVLITKNNFRSTLKRKFDKHTAELLTETIFEKNKKVKLKSITIPSSLTTC